jgi:hypothetical protein
MVRFTRFVFVAIRVVFVVAVIRMVAPLAAMGPRAMAIVERLVEGQ